MSRHGRIRVGAALLGAAGVAGVTTLAAARATTARATTAAARAQETTRAGASVRPVAPGRDRTQAPAAGRTVAVTFDDLPANTFRPTLGKLRSITSGLLEGLGRHGIPAIGFVNESKLYEAGELDPRRVALLRAWLDAGLELGNHTYSHPDLHSTPIGEFEADVLAGDTVTRALLAEAGRAPRFFRHPFLHTGRSLEVRGRLEGFLAERGYRVAPVTIDNQEWIFARAYDHAEARGDGALARRVAESYVSYMDSIFGYYEMQSRALFGREIPQVLLLHANRLNAIAIDPLVEMMRRREYAFVSLAAALEDSAYASSDGYVGPGGITWLHRWALTAGERGDFFAGEPEVPPFVRAAFDDPPPP